MLAKLTNWLLGLFGITAIRQATLKRLMEQQGTEKPLDGLTATLQAMKIMADQNQRQLLHHQISVKWDMVDLLERQRPPRSHMTCPLCGHHNEVSAFNEWVTACIFGGGTLTRHQCPECDLIFGDEKMLRLSEAELSRDYEWHYQLFTEGDSTAQEIRAFHALQPRKDGIYLNWGAGAWSKTIEKLRQEGWDVYGYEPHNSATTHSSHIISRMEELAAMRFDGIFSNNVLEHLRHPARELSIMRSLLKSDGKMSHATPCFEYLYEFTRFHLFFYLGKSRTILASQAGLDIEVFVQDGEFMNIILAPK